MSELIILGGIRYDFLDLNDLIDSYERTARCNFGIPGNNNGTRSDIQILNSHIYKRFMVDKINKVELRKLYPSTYEEYVDNFYDYIKGKNVKKIIPQINPNKTLVQSRSILKSLNCPIRLEKLPRMGLYGILVCIHLQKTKSMFNSISVCGMGIDFTYLQTYYNSGKDNSKRSIYHNWENEHEIMVWLHNNDYIDATLCLLEKDENNRPFLNAKLLEPKKRTLEKLKQYYGDITIKH